MSVDNEAQWSARCSGERKAPVPAGQVEGRKDRNRAPDTEGAEGRSVTGLIQVGPGLVLTCVLIFCDGPEDRLS